MSTTTSARTASLVQILDAYLATVGDGAETTALRETLTAVYGPKGGALPEVEDSIVDVALGALLRYRAARISGDPIEIAHAATTITGLVPEIQIEIKQVRGQAARDLRAEGRPFSEIVEILGVNRARIDQLMKGISGGRYDIQKHSIDASTGRVVRSESE